MRVNNTGKLVQYLRLVSVDPLMVDGKLHKEYRTRIQLSKTFFDTDDCISCGACCVVEDNLFSQSEYETILKTTDQDFINHGSDPANLAKLKYGIVPEHHNINGNDIIFYVYKGRKTPSVMYIPQKGKVCEKCGWMYYDEEKDKFLCGIHLVTSITCKMPHLRFFYHPSSGCISLATSQYGRNWNLMCPMTFSPPDESNFDEIKQSRIHKLQLLENVAQDFKIETHLPKVISYIQNTTFENYKERVDKPIVKFNTVKKLF